MQVDSPDDLDRDVHQTKLSVKQEAEDREEFVDAVTTECQNWFDGNWDDKYRHWALEVEETGGTAEDQYVHVLVYVEPRSGTPEQLLSNWARRFVKSRIENQNADGGN